MKLHLDRTSANNIQRYDRDSVVINEQNYDHSLIVMPEYLSDWDVKNFDDLDIEHFKRLRALQPELVILGTGLQQQFPSPQLYAPLIEANIGLEVMDRLAACRTYNILVAEGRKVLAALIF
ncbi:Mth938-like domain-containing protein [Candidatus Albibeggiatoa sp. nov. NOAA]|uniref:Mth938-like domain-containing protein n=1 Tax=Candidatus Albibeggiatoa sp. nov. NOAA TaxID=3162724 RepID=UPI0032F8496B|nr:Mth938-like domain-containing protein [Thiotrichaceae bacterium]